MGYIKRFYDVVIHTSDRYAISLPILRKVEGYLCESVFFYSVRNGRIELLGDIASRNVVTGKISEKKIVEVLTPEEYDRVLSTPVDLQIHPSAGAIRQEYLVLHEAVIISGRQLEDFERQLMASLLVRVVPKGGLLELYRVLANECFV